MKKILLFFVFLFGLVYFSSNTVLATCGGYIPDRKQCLTSGSKEIPNATRCGLTVKGSINPPVELCCSSSDECTQENTVVPGSLTETNSKVGDVYYNQFNSATGNTLGIGDLFLTNLISKIYPVAIILAGLLLLLLLVAGGFTMLSNPTNPQAQDGGKQRIKWAIVGFLVLFASYWIMQILQVVFGIRIVS